jgi:hypothetical protein
MESIEDQMLFVTFNQDASCFAVGTEKGFKIFNSFPFKDSFERSKFNYIILKKLTKIIFK